MKEKSNNYEMIINYIEKTKPNHFIENFLNQNLIYDKKYLINTQFSKKNIIQWKFFNEIIQKF